MQFQFPFYIYDLADKEISTYIFQEGRSIREMQVALKIATKIMMRTRLAEAQNHKCCFCGVETFVGMKVHARYPTIEHIKCRSDGGTDDWDNLAMSCYRCNQKRGDTEIGEWLKTCFSE